MKHKTKVKIIDFVKKVLKFKEPVFLNATTQDRIIYTIRHDEVVEDEMIEMYSFNSIFEIAKIHAANKLAEELIKNDLVLFESEGFIDKTIFKSKLDVVIPFKK